MAEKVRVKVIGPRAVAGVHRPELVDLDPEETNIDLLVATGHVERVEHAPPEPGPAPDPVTAPPTGAQAGHQKRGGGRG